MIDNTDIAFLALGAEHGLAKLDGHVQRELCEKLDGYVGIIREVIDFSVVLDDVWSEVGAAFCGSWAYEVAEPAGESIVKLLAGDDPWNAETVREIVRELVRDANTP